MSFPQLPIPAEDEVLLVATRYEDGRALWGKVRDLLGEDGPRLRPVENSEWDALNGGDFAALVPTGSQAPVVVLADIPAVHGNGRDLLLIDVREIPGRGVRVATEALGRVLTDLLAGSLRFDELVEGMDRDGVFEGHGYPAQIRTPTAVIRTGFPQLPAYGATLLVRTDFGDPDGWLALLDELGELDDENRTQPDYEDTDECPLDALVVDDRAFEFLQPGQVPALVPAKQDTAMVALADAVTMAGPDRLLLVVNLYEAPGQAIRVPVAEVGLMAANLQIGNMDFAEFGYGEFGDAED